MRKNITPYLFLIPTFLALLLFSVYPLMSGIWYSFTDISFVGGEAEFVGLDNFINLLKGNIGSARFFKQSFVQTAIWTASVVGGQFIIGLITALLLNREFFGRTIYRVLILLPWAIPSAVMALTWQWMYDPFFGLINFILKTLGFISKYQVWVGQPTSTIWPQVIVAVWRGIPFMTIMLLSGLQSIPKELYEAAKIDGANWLQSFLKITLPSMKTIITIVLMLTVMWWWNSFDIQKIMSPVNSLGYKASTLPILAWFESFQWKHLGKGAAISVVSLVVLMIFMVGRAKSEMESINE